MFGIDLCKIWRASQIHGEGIKDTSNSRWIFFVNQLEHIFHDDEITVTKQDVTHFNKHWNGHNKVLALAIDAPNELKWQEIRNLSIKVEVTVHESMET